jgi:RHS repeat-associated protein
MIFAGTVNEPASVTIQGAPATVSSTNDFRGTASLTTGTNTVTIVATDPSGNSTTRQWTVDVVGQAKTFTFDANGNLTSDGTRTFEWDARNQLIAIDVATRRTEFTYDGLQRRVRVVEKNNEIVQSETKVVWCGNEHCEERGGDGTTVNRRSFALGEQTGGSARLFAIDHLGSVNIVTDVAATQLGAFTYDPWGRRTIVSGSAVTNAGFTGHNWQADGALWLTQYRGFDTDAGRWLSEDPNRFLGGDNFFAYVANNPVNRNDPSGLAPDSCPTCTPRFHTASYYSCLLTTTGGAGVAFATCLAAKRFYGPAAAVVCEVVGLAGWIGLCIQCATYCDGPGQGPGRDCFDGSELPPNRPNVGPPPPNRWPPVRRK